MSTPQPVQTQSKSSAWGRPLVALSYLLSTASLLNLIQDLSPLALYGKLKVWIDAYSLVVHSIGDFLFSWMHFAWLGISRTEHHVIAIAGLLGVSAYRATYKVHREWGYDFGQASEHAQPFVALYFALAFFPCLLLPDHWGTALSAVCVIAYSTTVFRHKHSPWGPISSQAPGAAVLRELLGILAILLIVLVINYAIFRPTGA